MTKTRSEKVEMYKNILSLKSGEKTSIEVETFSQNGDGEF